MKVCFKCNQEKDLSEFYKHKQMADGHLNKCKECTKMDVSKNYKENIDQYKEYEKSRANLPHRIDARNAYANSPQGRESGNRGSRNWSLRNPEKRKLSLKKWIENNKEKRDAHNAVLLALYHGTLKKQPCESCGEISAQAHHDDYSKPLDVRWLCSSCHAAHHKSERLSQLIAA